MASLPGLACASSTDALPLTMVRRLATLGGERRLSLSLLWPRGRDSSWRAASGGGVGWDSLSSARDVVGAGSSAGGLAGAGAVRDADWSAGPEAWCRPRKTLNDPAATNTTTTNLLASGRSHLGATPRVTPTGV
jgi:hypothetical protein